MCSDKIKRLQEWLAQNDEIDFAMLFGSYAKGAQSPGSDMDVAIRLVSGLVMSAEQKLGYMHELGKMLTVEIDLVDLSGVGQPLLSQIIKYGKLLKGNNTQYAELAIKNINTTQDFMPYIERMMSERRAERLPNG